MHFSTEQEAALIEENMKKIYRAVDNFCCRCHGSTVRVDYDEFVSEVSIVFLKHIRKCETMEEINKFPWYDALNAMTRLVMAYQPLSGPKTPKHFSRLVSRMPATVSIDLAVANGIEVDGIVSSASVSALRCIQQISPSRTTTNGWVTPWSRQWRLRSLPEELETASPSGRIRIGRN